MMPPTPSISRMSCSGSIALGRIRRRVDVDACGLRAAPRGRARAARESATARCDRSPAASTVACRAPRAGCRDRWRRPGRVEAAHDRLDGVDLRPICRKCRIRPAVTKVLPTSVPVAVMKIAVTRSAPQNAPAHDIGKPLDVVVGVLRGECKPQPCGAGRHSGRADRDHQKAFVREQRARPPAPHSARRQPPARWRFALAAACARG